MEAESPGRTLVDKIKFAVHTYDLIQEIQGKAPCGPDGQGRLMGLCPFHEDMHESLRIFDSGGFKCFTCDAKGGDVIDFWSHYRGLDTKAAIRELAERLNDLALPEEPARRPKPELPPVPVAVPIPEAVIPAVNAKVTLARPGEKPVSVTPTMVHVYRDRGGVAWGLVLRYLRQNERKAFLPARWDGEHWWAVGPDAPRLLYGLQHLQRGQRVLIVEGEKAADAARRMALSSTSVVTWSGGCNALEKTDWNELADHSVLLWPDNDTPGRKAMDALGEILTGIASEIGIVNPVGLPEHGDAVELEEMAVDFTSWIEARVSPWTSSEIHVDCELPPEGALRSPSETNPLVREWDKIRGDGSDVSIAELFRITSEFGENWRYVQSSENSEGRWYTWNGVRWADSSDGHEPPITESIERLQTQIEAIVLLLEGSVTRLKREFDELVSKHPFDNGKPRLVTSPDPTKGLDGELRAAVDKKLSEYRASKMPASGWAKALQTVRSAGGQSNVAKVLRNHLGIPVDKLDANRHRVTFPAGLGVDAVTIDFDRVDWGVVGKDLAKVPTNAPRRDDYCTMVAGGPWKPGAWSEVTDQIWSHVFSNEMGEVDFESWQTVNRLFGMALAGRTETHFAPIFHGQGGTGKSQLIGATEFAFGDFAVDIKAKALSESKRDSSHDRDLVRIRSKRLVVVSEVGRYIVLGRLFKQLSGGDKVPMADAYARSEASHVLEGMIAMVGNEPPTMDATDEGIWRRVLEISCDHQVPENQRGRDLKQLYQTPEAAAALIQHFVCGLCEYHATDPPRLKISESILNATRVQREDSDPLPAWHDACLISIPTGSTLYASSFVSTADLMASFSEFARSRGARNQYGSVKVFSQAFNHTYGGAYKLVKSPARGYRGLSLKPSMARRWDAAQY